MLYGLKVLDLTHYVAGPYATRLMAAQSAEVIKVERPATGDGARRIGPFPDDVPHPEKSALFLYLNTGKKSVTLNLKNGASNPILRQLAGMGGCAGGELSPWRDGTAGVGLRKRCGCQSGAGDDFRLELRADRALPRLWGARNQPVRNGRADVHHGRPGARASAHGGALAQYGAGQNAFAGTLGALLHRDITGIGQHVDVAISEYLATILENALSQYSYTGSNFRRTGNRGYGRAAWGPYPCQDGYVGVIAGPDHKWPEMAELMGIAELAEERFDDRAGRGENADELDALMLPWLMRHDRHEIFERAQHRGLAFAYVAAPEDILGWEHLRERGFFGSVEHPKAGCLEHPMMPWRVEDGGWELDAAPMLGQHNIDVYCGMLGYSKAELVRMRGMGVV